VLRSREDAGERRVLVSALAVIGGLNLIGPNSEWDWGRTVEFAGLQQSLAAAHGQGVAEVVLPDTYVRLTPDRFYKYGTRMVFMKFSEPEKGRDYLRSNRTPPMLLPPYR